MNKPYTVVIADDHEGVRKGIKTLIEKGGQFVVVGQAEDGKKAVKLVNKTDPDLLILDVKLPVMRGEEVAQRLTSENPEIKILALSSFDNPQYILGMFESGVRGYLTKEEAPRLLRKAASEIVAKDSEHWLSPDLKAQSGITFQQTVTHEVTISVTEHKILALLKEGRTKLEIANSLNFPMRRLERYLQILMMKFEVDDLDSLREKS